jgi:hypothetical protein
VITTDGYSNSGGVSRSKAIEALQRAAVSVVGLFPGRDTGELRKLIQDTGGWLYGPSYPRVVADIDSDLRHMVRRRQSQYFVTFQSVPPKRPGALREVQIRPVGKNLKEAKLVYRRRY